LWALWYGVIFLGAWRRPALLLRDHEVEKKSEETWERRKMFAG
jgi:hypothetical protein